MQGSRFHIGGPAAFPDNASDRSGSPEPTHAREGVDVGVGSSTAVDAEVISHGARQLGAGAEDTAQNHSELYRRSAGARTRNQLHHAPVGNVEEEDPLLQSEEGRFGMPEAPTPFEVDEHGILKTESLPAEIKALFEVAQRVHHFVPANVQNLAAYAVFDLALGSAIQKFVPSISLGSVRQELNESLNAISYFPQPGIEHGRWEANENLHTLTVFTGASAMLNLLGIVALASRLYYFHNDQTMFGLMKAVFGVVAQVASLAVNGAAFMQLQSVQSTVNESRAVHEKLRDDPRLDIPANFDGEPGLLPGRMFLTRTIEEKISELTAQRLELQRDYPSTRDMLAAAAFSFVMALDSAGLLPSIPSDLSKILPGR
jgi:hypothetical protein